MKIIQHNANDFISSLFGGGDITVLQPGDTFSYNIYFANADFW